MRAIGNSLLKNFTLILSVADKTTRFETFDQSIATFCYEFQVQWKAWKTKNFSIVCSKKFTENTWPMNSIRMESVFFFGRLFLKRGRRSSWNYNFDTIDNRLQTFSRVSHDENSWVKHFFCESKRIVIRIRMTSVFWIYQFNLRLINRAT